MERLRLLVGAALCVLLASPVTAQTCATGTRITTGANSLASLLRGNTVCAAKGNDRWQEFHAGTGNSGDLIDWKHGPNDRSDPTAKVGTWSISPGANATVTYNYGPGAIYTYQVWQVSPGVYNFCGGTPALEVTGAQLKSGQVAC